MQTFKMAETQAQRQERQRADELTYWKRQHAELVKEMEAQQAQMAEAARRLEREQELTSKLRKAREGQQDFTTATEEQHAKAIVELSAERNELRDCVAELKRRLATAQGRADSAGLSEMEERLKMMHKRHAALAQQLDARTKERNEAVKRAGALKQERDDLEKSLNSSQDHRQQLLSAISDLRPEK